MHILLTGGTGLIGRQLCQHWIAEGHRLTVWSRRPEQVARLCGDAVRGIGRLEELAEEPLDAVVNLAGAPIAVPAYRGERFAMLKALADMNVSLADGAGARLGGGKGSDILEHPLNAVVWLAGALAQEGLAMQPGDLISLGSFSPLLPPKAGLSVTATYNGLPGAAPVRVTFK